MTIDIGPKTEGLIQQLATQLGVTVDKVFPWYVKQSLIEGYTSLTLSIVFTVFCVISYLILFSYRRMIGEKDRSGVLILTMIIILITHIPFLANLSENLSKVTNPEYHAMNMILKTIAGYKNNLRDFEEMEVE